MFPESFVAEQLLAYTRPAELVFDPFCGRGTTILESLLNGRAAIGSDINPVAACVSGAKAQVPELSSVLARLEKLERDFCDANTETAPSEFFRECFHPETYSEIAFLRRSLAWKTHSSDRFIAALALGVLHGESHRTALCLSNRMPRTISTKPEYSVRWWRLNSLTAPRRETFKILRQAAIFRYAMSPPKSSGEVFLCDSRQAGDRFRAYESKVALVVTSPPYLDTTDYSEDQWLRLWFLGGNERPIHRLNKDDRHTDVGHYWSFIREVWQGMSVLLRENATIVVRIGGMRFSKEDLFEGLSASIRSALPTRNVKALNSGTTSEIAKRQTNSFRPGTKASRLEHDFVYSVS